jgi:hypothetical protein
MKPKAPKLFATEADLCTAFLASVDSAKWVPYPETAGWDVLMVRRADGFQIGIQAKQKLNTEVINQALEDYHHWSSPHPGPDCRALLVPSSNGFSLICKYLALVVIVPVQQHNDKWRFSPYLPDAPPAPQYSDWPEWAPAKRHKLPDYVPDVIAGASGPVQLTDWKIKAIKLAVMLERAGSVCRADFAFLRLDHRRWVEGRWLQLENGAFVRGSGWPQFDKIHPRVYKEIAADFAKWGPPVPSLKQTALL